MNAMQNAGRMPGVKESAEANSTYPWRRNRGRLRARSGEGIGDRLGDGIARRKEDLRDVLIEEFDLFREQKRLLLLLGLAALLNHRADLAGMPSIKGFLHRFGESPFFGVIHDHCGPCDRLQDRPMSADGHKQCRDQQPAAD